MDQMMIVCRLLLALVLHFVHALSKKPISKVKILSANKSSVNAGQ